MAAVDVDEALVIAKLSSLIGGQAQVGSKIVGPGPRISRLLDALFRNALGGDKRGSRHARIGNGVIAVADFVNLLRQFRIENFRRDGAREFVKGSGESFVDGACSNGVLAAAAALNLRRNPFFGLGSGFLGFGNRFPGLACVLQALFNLAPILEDFTAIFEELAAFFQAFDCRLLTATEAAPRGYVHAHADDHGGCRAGSKLFRGARGCLLGEILGRFARPGLPDARLNVV